MKRLVALFALFSVVVSGCAGGKRPLSGGWEADSLHRASAVWIQADVRPSRSVQSASPAFADQVFAVILADAPGLRRCYLKALKGHHSLEGELWILFRLGGSGDVLEASVDYTTLGGPELEPCILKRFRSYSMPAPPEEGYRVRFPLVFTSPGTPPEVMTTLKTRYRLELLEEQKQEDPKQEFDEAPW